MRDEREAEALRATLEVLDDALAIPRLVGGDARIGVRHAEAEGLVEEHRQLARRRRDRLGLADARGQASVERAEGRLRPSDIDGRDPEEGRRAIGRATSRGAEHPAAGDLIGRREAQPRREVLGRRPPRHVVAALGDQSQHRVRTETVDLTEVGAQESVQHRPDVEGRFVAALRVPLRGEWRRRCRALRRQRPQRRLDLRIALGDLVLMEVVQLERLPQREDMLGR